MPPPLDREMLKSMKRADLQRVCKEYGIKANLKTEALIDLLIDTTQARPRTTPSVPKRAPSGRRASRSVPSGSRLRGTSSSSVIIHDTDEEDNTTEQGLRSSVAPAPSSGSEAPPLPPRTRRAKETQYRLGVGRPTVVGGSGARAVTRSTSLAGRTKRGKGSKSVKPIEAAIQEEEEPEPIEPDVPEAGPSGTTHDHQSPSPPPPPPPPIPDPQEQPIPTPPPAMSPSISHDLKGYIAELVTPLQTQVLALQSELQQRSSKEADVNALTSQLHAIQAEVQALRSQADTASQLRNEVDQLKFLVSTLMQGSASDFPKQSEKSSGKARASDEGDSQVIGAARYSSQGHQSSLPESGTQPLLGKRHRDADDSDVTDVVEAGPDSHYSQEDLAKRAVRPTKKKLKLSDEGRDQVQPSTLTDVQGDARSEGVEGDVQPVPRPPPTTFTVFSGPEEPPESYVDPPPPTTHLSDLIPMNPGASAQATTPVNGAGAIVRPVGADENAPNHFGFNFSFNTSIFHPMTSTPFDMGNPSFPYPEPPTSPSPGTPAGGFVERAGGRIERNDVYHPHGRRHAQSQAQAQGEGSSQTLTHPQSTASRAAGASSSGDGTVNPNALLAASSALPSVPETAREDASSSGTTNGARFASQTRRVASSNEIGMAFGMSSTLPLPPETPAPPMKRTMYGTELESDTRFGDFGVEGVATGFWAGLVPRF